MTPKETSDLITALPSRFREDVRAACRWSKATYYRHVNMGVESGLHRQLLLAIGKRVLMQLNAKLSTESEFNFTPLFDNNEESELKYMHDSFVKFYQVVWIRIGQQFSARPATLRGIADLSIYSAAGVVLGTSKEMLAYINLAQSNSKYNITYDPSSVLKWPE